LENFINFSGKHILVTGASSGIGFEICQQISKYGGGVIGVGRNNEKLNFLAEQIENFQGIKFDLNEIENINELIQQIDVPLDGIVHAAGIVQLLPIKFFDIELFNKIRRVNYDSILVIISKLLKTKKINKGASIIFISSIAGEYGMKGNSIYSSTKAALNSTAKVLAAELAAQLIRVNTIAPGQVETNLTDQIAHTISDEAIAADKKKYPLGYGNPEDIANLSLFLLSSKSQWMTGTVINIDGGRTGILN